MRSILTAIGFLSALILAALASPVLADNGRRISDRTEFVSLVAGKALTHIGVNLRVSGTGAITGRAFGKQVTGSWDWQNGFFCRTLNWGDERSERNCQLVELEGARLRFTSDRGAGDYARLRLR